MSSRQKAWLLPAAAAAVTVGILAGRLTASPLPGIAGILLACAAVWLLQGWWRFCAVLAVFLTAGCLSSSVAFHPALPAEGTCLVSGIIGDELRLSGSRHWRTRLSDVTLDGRPLRGDAYWSFYAEELPEGLVPGKQVSFSANLYHPSVRENPGGFDFREYLLQRGITVGLYGKEDLTVSDPGFFSFSGLKASVRHRLTDHLLRLMGEKAGGYASALILGNQSLLPPEERASFSRLGIAHVLSVSGFHVGLIIGVLALLFRLLALPQEARLALYAVLLYLYSALCGMNQPVLRASLLTLLTVEGRILNRPRSGLHLLSAAYIFLLLLSPPQITGISFQLSFGAMLGIVLVTPRLSGLCPFRHHFARTLWGSFSVLAGAQLGILWPELSAFQTFPLLSILTNLPVTFLVSVIIYLDWLVLLFSWLPPLARLFAFPAVGLTELLTEGVSRLGSLPGITVWTHSPGVLTVLCVCLLLAVCSSLFHMKKRIRLPLLAAGLGLLVISLLPQSHTVTEYFQFSDGDADAALIWDRNQAVVLDTGEADGVLSGFLRRNRLTPDAVIVTHLHMDHAGGLASLMTDRIPVPVCYLPWGAREALVDEHALVLLDQLEASGTEIRFLARGDTLDLPSGTLSVLWPEEGKVRPGQNANEYSLTSLLTLHGVTLLHTGDLDGRYEMYAAQPADLLKIAHHGSLSSCSPAFLAAVSPQAALLSCSRPERHEQTAERLDSGTSLFSTALHGALTVIFSENAFSITPFLDPASKE